MSKTFGQLKSGDEVYVINGNSVEIVKVSVAATRYNSADTLLRMSGCVFHVPAVHVQFYNEAIGDIYCDVYEAVREMKKRYNANIIECKKTLDSLLLLEECLTCIRQN